MPSGPHRTVTAAATDIGRRRSSNEDQYAVWFPDGTPTRDTLLVVCDGMGGSNAGEVASRMAVEAVVREFAKAGTGDPLEYLARAVQEANHEIWEHSRTRADLEGMGTTCTVALLRGQDVFVAHVGDSRAYLVRHGRIRQITTDHSLVAQLVASKQLDPEAAREDRRRNVVTRSVGVGPQVEVDRVRLDEPLQAGDTLVLCSDGLHGLLTNDEIGRVSSQHGLDSACKDLVALANDRGGTDNITVVMGRFETEEHAVRRSGRKAHAPAATANTSTRRTLKLLIAALVGLALTLAGLFWVMWGMMRASRTNAASVQNVADTDAGERLAWR